MEELRFQIADEMEDERLDKCMSLLVENLSRSFIQKLIKDGNVLVNGQREDKAGTMIDVKAQITVKGTQLK